MATFWIEPETPVTTILRLLHEAIGVARANGIQIALTADIVNGAEDHHIRCPFDDPQRKELE